MSELTSSAKKPGANAENPSPYLTALPESARLTLFRLYMRAAQLGLEAERMEAAPEERQGTSRVPACGNQTGPMQSEDARSEPRSG